MSEANELFDSIEEYKCKDVAEKLDKSMHFIAEFKELSVPDWYYNQNMSVLQQLLTIACSPTSTTSQLIVMMG